MKTCYVYIIAIDDHSMSKIGISEGPDGRLAQLSTGSPFKMELAGVFATPSREIAREIEAEFHRIQAGARTTGEWFKINSTDAFLLVVQLFVAYFYKKTGHENADRLLRAVGIPEEFQDYVDFCRTKFGEWAMQQ